MYTSYFWIRKAIYSVVLTESQVLTWRGTFISAVSVSAVPAGFNDNQKRTTKDASMTVMVSIDGQVNTEKNLPVMAIFSTFPS